MSGWRGIETRPAEGFFLICDANSLDFECSVTAVCNLAGGGFGDYLPEDADEHLPYIDGTPTHWMPIPRKPKP